MTPIQKNIHVVDEQGREYEAAWPRRARGLVKTGRARFLSGNTIYLVCPPNLILGDTEMNDNVELSWPLQQIAALQNDTEYLKERLAHLSQMNVGGKTAPYEPEDVAGQAKANALRDIIQGRESTNKQLMRLYEKMYGDFLHRTPAEEL